MMTSPTFLRALSRGVLCATLLLGGLGPGQRAARGDAAKTPLYSTRGNQILKDGVPFEGRGVNAMYEFGGTGDITKEWPTIDIMRETMHFMSAQPIEGAPALIDGKNIQSLQSIVDHNRSRGQITLFSPHGWDGTRATWFQSHNPRETAWWEDYKIRYRAIAAHFKDQPDVWLEVWNEPYQWQDGNGYSDALWLRDMSEMVDNIRSTGACNIVVVPGARNGGGEGVIVREGAHLLAGRSNVLFDVHAYDQWIGEADNPRPQTEIEARLKAVQDAGMPLIIGEYGTWNNNWLSSVEPLLRACRDLKISTAAWVWQAGTSDQNALRKTGALPNDTERNHNYGSTVKTYLAEPRGAVAP